MTAPLDSHAPNTRYVARKRRVTEDKRLAAGRGNFIQDIALPGMLHVAVLASPHPRAKILSIDASAALALPGVAAVLTGAQLSAATNPLYGGLPTPEVKWYPLAVDLTRYAGEWVAVVAATSRAIAEDAIEAEKIAAREHIADAERVLKAAGMTRVEGAIVSGAPGDAIVSAAKARKAAIVMMATHGRHGIKRAFMGSVSEDVLRNLEGIPVLVLNPVGE